MATGTRMGAGYPYGNGIVLRKLDKEQEVPPVTTVRGPTNGLVRLQMSRIDELSGALPDSMTSSEDGLVTADKWSIWLFRKMGALGSTNSLTTIHLQRDEDDKVAVVNRFVLPEPNGGYDSGYGEGILYGSSSGRVESGQFVRHARIGNAPLLSSVIMDLEFVQQQLPAE